MGSCDFLQKIGLSVQPLTKFVDTSRINIFLTISKYVLFYTGPETEIEKILTLFLLGGGVKFDPPPRSFFTELKKY